MRENTGESALRTEACTNVGPVICISHHNFQIPKGGTREVLLLFWILAHKLLRCLSLFPLADSVWEGRSKFSPGRPEVAPWDFAPCACGPAPLYTEGPCGTLWRSLEPEGAQLKAGAKKSLACCQMPVWPKAGSLQNTPTALSVGPV